MTARRDELVALLAPVANASKDDVLLQAAHFAKSLKDYLAAARRHGIGTPQSGAALDRFSTTATLYAPGIIDALVEELTATPPSNDQEPSP